MNRSPSQELEVGLCTGHTFQNVFHSLFGIYIIQTSVGVSTYAVCAVLAFLGQGSIGEVLSPPESVLASKRCLLCYCPLVFRPIAAPFEVCEEQLAFHGVLIWR